MWKVFNMSDSKGFAKLAFNEVGQIAARFINNPEVLYIYSNVPKAKLNGLKKAERKGSYFFANIRSDQNISFEIRG